jgi:hypothetical protein
MPRLCRSVTPEWLVITEATLAFATGIAGVACAATKNWIPGFVLLAVAVLCGMHADGSLRVKLATTHCGNGVFTPLLITVEVWTALLLLFWLAMCIWCATQKSAA